MPPSHSCKLVSITNDNVGQVSLLLQCNIQQFACLRNYSYNDEEKTPHFKSTILCVDLDIFPPGNNTSCCGELLTSVTGIRLVNVLDFVFVYLSLYLCICAVMKL